MKKLFLFLPLLITPFLGACEGKAESTFLTFGTLKDSEAIQLTSSEFSTHVENNENFLLAIYPRDSTCSCWRNFSSVINEAVKEDHLLIYKYCAEDVSDNQVMKEIGGFNDRLDAPTFYIIKEKQIAKYYNYSSKTDFFKTRDGFISELRLDEQSLVSFWSTCQEYMNLGQDKYMAPSVDYYVTDAIAKYFQW